MSLIPQVTFIHIEAIYIAGVSGATQTLQFTTTGTRKLSDIAAIEIALVPPTRKLLPTFTMPYHGSVVSRKRRSMGAATHATRPMASEKKPEQYPCVPLRGMHLTFAL